MTDSLSGSEAGAQRRARVLARLREVGVLSVADLARELGVSQMTVRRDLHRLETIGQVSVSAGPDGRGVCSRPTEAASTGCRVASTRSHSRAQPQPADAAAARLTSVVSARLLRRRERRIYGARSTTQQSLLEDDPLSNVERP